MVLKIHNYMKKKIIFFCPSIEIGGVEKNLFKVANFLSAKNEDVSVITFDEKHVYKNFSKNVKIISVKFLNKLNLPYFFKVLFCIINYFLKYGLKKNLIFVSFQSNLYFILLAKLTRNKIIARSNAAPNYYISNYVKLKLFQKIYNLADKIIVNSIEFKKKFFKIFKVRPIMIYNPSFKKKYSKTKKLEKIKKSGVINFLNIGRLTDQKNQIVLLKAFSEINNLSYKLTIIGNGSKNKELKKFKLNKNLQIKIKIINNIIDTKKFLRKCDVFILSSKFEGLPNVLIEAQIMKKFIISADCPTGPREILKNGNAGYLFNNNDYKDLKKNIIRFILKKNSVEIKNKIKIGFKNLYRFDENENLEKYYKEIKNL